MTSAVAYRAAELRAKDGLKTSDSIQVGTALEYGAKYFLTNDIRLKIVKEIKAITPRSFEKKYLCPTLAYSPLING